MTWLPSLASRAATALRRAIGWRPSATGTSSAPGRDASGRGSRPAPGASAYPGDFLGPFAISYQPGADALPDPGEVIWTWVPFQEDPTQGKDRPALVVGRDHHWLLAVPLTSKDHDRDAAQEAAEGRYWIDIGSGDWDRSGRPSEVRVNRVIRVDPHAVRRVASRLDERRFAAVAAAIRQYW